MSAELFDVDEVHRHKVYGKHRGLVVDNQDTEGLGQLQVQVPTVLGKDLKVWAKPCFSSGHFFVPPIGAGVWVEFEAGDPSYPIWVGTWYPLDQVPPEATTPHHDHRIVHTPSGHVVELSDEAGKEKVVVRHKLDSFLSIDEKGSALLANHKGAHLYLNADAGELSLTSEQGHTVSMTADGVIVASGDGKTVITVENDKVTVAGPKVAVVADEIALSGGAVSVGPKGMFSLIAGEPFWTAFMTHTHTTAMGPSGPVLPIPPLTPVLGPPMSIQGVKAG